MYQSVGEIKLFPPADSLWLRHYSEKYDMRLICPLTFQWWVKLFPAADSAEAEAPRAPPPTQINKMKWDNFFYVLLLVCTASLKHNFQGMLDPAT